jgi:hypothetical protein
MRQPNNGISRSSPDIALAHHNIDHQEHDNAISEHHDETPLFHISPVSEAHLHFPFPSQQISSSGGILQMPSSAQEEKKEQEVKKKVFAKLIVEAVISAVAALITFLMHTSGSTTTVGASSIVAVVAGVVLDSPFREIVHGASFVGMTSTPNPSNPWNIAQTALVVAISGLAFAVSLRVIRKKFVGLGGRLGALAFLCSFTSSAILNMSVKITSFPLEFFRWEFWLVTPIVGILSSVATHKIQVLRDSNASLASAVVAIACVGLFSSKDVLEWPGTKYLQIFALCGSFVGMSNSLTRFKFGILQFAIAGLLSSFCLCALIPFAPGVGGKFGFSSLVSTTIVFYISEFLHKHSIISLPASNENERASSEKVIQQQDEVIQQSTDVQNIPSQERK